MTLFNYEVAGGVSGSGERSLDLTNLFTCSEDIIADESRVNSDA